MLLEALVKCRASFKIKLFEKKRDTEQFYVWGGHWRFVIKIDICYRGLLASPHPD